MEQRAAICNPLPSRMATQTNDYPRIHDYGVRMGRGCPRVAEFPRSRETGK
jgi:hypothetical protein